MTGVNFFVTGYGYNPNDIHRALFENEVYFYANIKGSNVSVPLDMIPYSIQTEETEPCSITVNDKENESKDTISNEIKLLNILQIVLRERELNIDEVKQLCAITENPKMSEDTKVGAYDYSGYFLSFYIDKKSFFDKTKENI